MGPVILEAEVMHARPGPVANRFRYGVWYLGLPLSRLYDCSLGRWFGVNRRGLTGIRVQDYGPRTGEDLLGWITDLLAAHGEHGHVDEILLVTMPRVLGFGFNPVSFWMCLDGSGGLRAVLCEVSNTYGESHAYLCRHGDGRPIRADDLLCAEKCFHVSPFLARDGRYEFRFALTQDALDIGIRHFAENGELRLATSLRGNLLAFNAGVLRRMFWRYLLVPLKAWLLIHWQALKLKSRGLRFRSKPAQRLPVVTITKM